MIFSHTEDEEMYELNRKSRPDFLIISSSSPSLQILATLVGSTSARSEHKEELTALKEQLKELNMMDEFAKYAKIQRKINKLTESISSESMTFRLID